MELRLLTFNVLASNYVNLEDYPGVDPFDLETETRRNRLVNFFSNFGKQLDIIALQEVTFDGPTPCSNGTELAGEYKHYLEALTSDFAGVYVKHDPSYWSEIHYDRCAHLANGNALFYRQSLFELLEFNDHGLVTGNHLLQVTLRHKPSNLIIRIINVHLDSESEVRRRYELAKAVSLIPSEESKLDLILGDFNGEVINSNTEGYQDLLYQAQNITGKAFYLPTYSVLSGYTEKPIDHILYRGPEIGIIENKTGVLTQNKDYTFSNFLRLYGSDHIPVLATIII